MAQRPSDPPDDAYMTAVRAHQDGASNQTGLSALVTKLRHPLIRIRARALENILFKVRQGLLDLAIEPQHTVDALASALVDCLAETELEPSALHLLELVSSNTLNDVVARVVATSLQRHGAPVALQRGAMQSTRPELQRVYESVLNRLLLTPSLVPQHETGTTLVNSTTMAQVNPANVISSARHTSTSQTRDIDMGSKRRQSHESDQVNDKLTTSGWKFPHVPLAIADEQFLFEMEVKWRLRSSVEDLVAMCDTFRRDLLRDFPAQVFLQRPAMLLRVLELARQPIIPAPTSPELSFGVNYFDEPSVVDTFVWKPSTRATALHIASIKAIESWLSALRHSMKVSLDPTYHVFESALSSTLLPPMTSGFDHRRLYYPQAYQSDTHASSDDSISLSGAAYQISLVFIRLLTGSSYPRAHLLNIVRHAIQYLPDRSIASGSNRVHPDEKQRVENMLIAVTDVIDSAAIHTLSVVECSRLVDCTIDILRLHQPEAYKVLEHDEGNGCGEIVVPRLLWTWLVEEIALDETKGDSVDYLGRIEPTTAKFIEFFQERMAFGQQLQEALERVRQEPTTATDLGLARRLTEMYTALGENELHAASEYVLDTIKNALETSTGSGSHDDQVSHILLWVLKSVLNDSSDASQQFPRTVLKGLLEWTSGEFVQPLSSHARVRQLVIATAKTGSFVELLLCALCGNGVNSPEINLLWQLAEQIFDALARDPDSLTYASALDGSMALMQHYAYAQSNSLGDNAENHRRVQRTFVQLVHQLEPTQNPRRRLLIVSRCLLHHSAYIRRAAAGGLSMLLKQLTEYDESSSVKDPFCDNAVEGSGDFTAVFASLLHLKRTDSTHTASSGSSSATLHRVTNLRKLLLSSDLFKSPTTISAESTEASVLYQLAVDLSNASQIDFSIVVEAGETQAVMNQVLGALSSCSDHTLRASMLAVVRIVLQRSTQSRELIRSDIANLKTLLTFAFDEDRRVRAEVYFIVLVLTCSLEVVAPGSVKGNEQDAQIVSEFSSTFGLYSSKWKSWGIPLRSLKDVVKDVAISAAERVAPSSIVAQRSEPLASYADQVWHDVLSAKSYRTFLDSVYSVMQVSDGSRSTETIVAEKWSDSFINRFADKTPTSSKDSVVVAAVLALANSLFDALSNDQRMKIMLVLRQHIVPLQLASSRETAMSLQLARFLLHVSESSLSDMFASIVIDTGLVNKVTESLTSASSLQQALWLNVLRKAVQTSSGQGQNRLIEEAQSLLPALRTIASRHRVPGTFQGRDNYVQAVSILVLLEDRIDSSSSWRPRLLFESSSTLRAVSFDAPLGFEFSESFCRLLRLAADTMRDESESDLVRAAAAQCVFRCMDNADGQPAQLEEVAKCIGGENFIPQVVHILIPSNQTMCKCHAALNLACLQLLRLSVSRAKEFTPRFGSTARLLNNGGDGDYRRLATLVELLSLHGAFASYQHHWSSQLHAKDRSGDIWSESILPIVLSTIVETARFVQSLMQTSVSTTRALIKGTPLVVRCIESIVGVSASLSNAGGDFDTAAATKLRLYHYESLDEVAKLLALLLSVEPSVSIPEKVSSGFVSRCVSLLDPEAHPRRFRLSFSRLISVIVQDTNSSFPPHVVSHGIALGGYVWITYKELCQQLQVNPSTWSAKASVAILPHLRRASNVVHAVCSNSDDAASSICTPSFDAVGFLVKSIQAHLTAIRMVGGFGAKKAAGSQNDYIVDMVACVEMHAVALSGLVASSSTAKEQARLQSLPSVLAQSWNTMLISHRRGSRVLTAVLRLLVNYIHGSTENKGSLTATNQGISTSDNERTLISIIGEYAVSYANGVSRDDASPHQLAYTVLKSALLHVECLNGAIKGGLTMKLFGRVVDICRRKRQTSKPMPQETEEVATGLLGIMASVAVTDEGRQVFLQQRELKNLVDDLLHFEPESSSMAAATLFIRNMVFSKVSKSYYAVWEAQVDTMLTVLGGTKSLNGEASAVTNNLSTALVWLVTDNQRAQSQIQGSDKTRVLLQDAVTRWTQRAQQMPDGVGHESKVIANNLARVVAILADGDTAQP